MANMQEFLEIAQQLEWLEAHLREQAPSGPPARLIEALGALACARAVVVKLAQIGSEVTPARSAETLSAEG